MKRLFKDHAIARMIAPAHFGIGRWQHGCFDLDQFVEQQPFFAVDTGALLRNVADVDRHGFFARMQHAVERDAQPHMAAFAGVARLVEQVIEIDLFEKAQSGMVVGVPDAFDAMAVAIGQLY